MTPPYGLALLVAGLAYPIWVYVIKHMKRLLGLALLIAGLAYPLGVYAMLGRVHAVWIMLPLAVLWLLRSLVADDSQPGGRLLPALAVAGCLVLACIGSTAGLLWYPVLISLLMLAAFGGSLFSGRPIIERLARLRHPDLPPDGIRYTRRVTQLWAGFFLFNGLMASALTLWAPWSWWAMYNGCISYMLIGALFAGEWLLRPNIHAMS